MFIQELFLSPYYLPLCTGQWEYSDEQSEQRNYPDRPKDLVREMVNKQVN